MGHIEETLVDGTVDCEDVAELCNEDVDNPRERGRAYRRKSEAHHKARLINSLENHSGRYCGTIYVKESEKGDKFLSRPKNSSRQQFHKKKSARRLRKAVDIPLKGNGARKLYDYKWEID